MVEVVFEFNGNSTIIQCQENQKLKEICDDFIFKSHLNENSINYIYRGLQLDKNVTFNEIANHIDQTFKRMYINVIINENEAKIKSKNIICPECGENIKMKINNYKINLFECKNKHIINNILLNEFEKTQIINLMNIKCDICKKNNKFINNKFYKCNECNINICPLCESKHDKKHNIIDYDKIQYICNKHNEIFINYCNNCKRNICTLCDKEHINHNKILLSNMIIEKEELITKLNILKKSINIFNNDINTIIQKLNKVKENINNYIKFEEYIINNYNPKERNYEILYNINEIINNNNIINEINKINNENNIENKFNNINNIYNKIYHKNEIKMKIKIEKHDINKNIYFLDNTDNKRLYVFYDFKINLGCEEHHHDFLKELNESNVEIYINNERKSYEKYFIPENEGDYNILLKFNILMEDCRFMFYNCKNITNIDLSSFNTQNVIDMSYMFDGCSNLTNINLSSFNTQNVRYMSCMFYGCSKLTNIDLSSFNTQNVIYMSYMFDGCSNLTNINLSSFNTQNVRYMSRMFNECSNLAKIDLSSFNTQNVTNMYCMFYGCSKLTNIDLSSFNTINVANLKKL